MLFYVLLIFSNSLPIIYSDKLDTTDIERLKKWAEEFKNRQINLIDSYGCINQIKSTYDEKAQIFEIEPSETLENTVDGIKKLFANKNNTLHRLVDDAQNFAQAYSLKIIHQNSSKNETIDSNENLNVELEFNNLTTESNEKQTFVNQNQNLSTYFKAIENPDNNQKVGPNDVNNNEIIRNQDESTNDNVYRFSFEEFQNRLVSEEESIQNQLEIDKKINESLNKIDYATTTPSSYTPSTETEESKTIEKESIKNETTTVSNSIEDDIKADYLYFKDTKKIYSPDKLISNSSSIPKIPKLPPDFDSLDKEKKNEALDKFRRWKSWTKLKTIKHGLFPNYRLNFSFSGLHIPLNVYPQQENVKNAIKWSENLDETFKENRKIDPYLSFQFFCSNDGFLRMHPLNKWRVPKLYANFDEFKDDDEVEEAIKNGLQIEENISSSEENDNDPSMALDFYDCRLRDWYIKAAAAPKDVMILIDSSGSMRGERSIIGGNVLINVLDTLTENDYVSIQRFNNSMSPIEECFGNDFVQANVRNVEKLKSKILALGHEENLDVSSGIANYSTIIEEAFRLLKNETRSGSKCNRIMMIVTDGDLDNMDDLFENLNKDGKIRVFTYLVGGEVMGSSNTESIACKNSGYFTHLKDLAEVKEEVQFYVPVLARSIGLRIYDPNAKLATTFSSIYSDQLFLSLTNMNWEKYENKVMEDKDFEKEVDDIEPELMITMSMPVFNTTNGNQTDKLKTSWDLIGVVGIDIPINEILTEIPFYRLGVNSHAFILNNNGFLVYHPDMRPLYKGFLKSFYTSLDFLEVELADDNKEARDENELLLGIRQSMINGDTNCTELKSKFHFKSMTRISTRKHRVCWRPIPNTLFSIAISVPSSYGSTRIKVPFKIEKDVNYSNFFDLEDSQWFVHPKWVYCWDNLYNSEVNREDRTEKILLEMTSEEIIEHFLETNIMNSSSFDLQDYQFNEEDENVHAKFFCNEELLSALVFDANATRIKLGSCSTASIRSNEILSLKPIDAFISTRSGLTRYFNFDQDNPNRMNNDFKRYLSIDENIYKRTADYSIKYDSKNYIFQLEKTSNETFITASRALLLARKKEIKKRKIRTPYAVVGMQFDYDLFLNSIKVPDFLNKPARMYFLDDNGYVLFGFDAQNQLIKDSSNQPSGLLLSEYDSELFEHLINVDIFKLVRIFDYQAICEEPKEDENAFNYTAYLIEKDPDDNYNIPPPPNRAQIVPCRKDYIFYELNRNLTLKLKEPKTYDFKRNGDKLDWYLIYSIPKTNLILIITSDDYEPIGKPYEPNIHFERNKCDRDTFHRKAPYMYKPYMCEPTYPDEKNIQACGSTSFAHMINLNTFVFSFILVFFTKFLVNFFTVLV